jgi:hypothetical protein
LEQLVL